jgi:hypothetical protein
VGLTAGLGVGEMCGAVSAGVLSIGLLEEDMTMMSATKKFVRRFVEVNGAVRCIDLIDLDLNSDDGEQVYLAQNLKKKTCNGLVSSAVELLIEKRKV